MSQLAQKEHTQILLSHWLFAKGSCNEDIVGVPCCCLLKLLRQFMSRKFHAHPNSIPPSQNVQLFKKWLSQYLKETDWGKANAQLICTQDKKAHATLLIITFLSIWKWVMLSDTSMNDYSLTEVTIMLSLTLFLSKTASKKKQTLRILKRPKAHLSQ